MAITRKEFDEAFKKAQKSNNVYNRYSKGVTGQSANQSKPRVTQSEFDKAYASAKKTVGDNSEAVRQRYNLPSVSPNNGIGQYGQGNIDLFNRPQYKNDDGTVSTVRSMSFNDNGKEVLVPTVTNDMYGKPMILTDDQAIQRYRDTGEYLGKFNTVEEANRYAEDLHNQQRRLSERKSNITNKPAAKNRAIEDLYRQSMYGQGYYGDESKISGSLDRYIDKKTQSIKDNINDINNNRISVDNSVLQNGAFTDDEIRMLENQGYQSGAGMLAESNPGQMFGIATARNVGGIINEIERTPEVLKANEQILSKDNAQSMEDFINRTMNATADTNVGEEFGKFKYYKSEIGKVKGKEGGLGYIILNEADKSTEKLLEKMSPEEQFVATTLISVMQNAELLPLSVIPGGDKAILALMSASAAGNTTHEKMQRGKSLNDAYLSGIVDGSIEAITESIGLDNLLKMLNGQTGGLIRSLAVQAGSEGAEEFVGYLANLAIEKLRGDPDAKFDLRELVQSTLSGALSGLILGGIGAGANIMGMDANTRGDFIRNAYTYENMADSMSTNTNAFDGDLEDVAQLLNRGVQLNQQTQQPTTTATVDAQGNELANDLLGQINNALGEERQQTPVAEPQIGYTDSLNSLREKTMNAPIDEINLTSEDVATLKSIGITDPASFENWVKEERSKMWDDFSQTEVPLEEAISTIQDNIPNNYLDGWFRNADSEYKPRIEAIIVSNPEVRNAGLNIAYDNYKKEKRLKGETYNGSFKDFLNEEMTLYRGSDSSKKPVASDVYVAYTPDIEEAKRFGSNITEIKIKPKDTYGSYQTTKEQEFLVPVDTINEKKVVEPKAKKTKAKTKVKAEAEALSEVRAEDEIETASGRMPTPKERLSVEERTMLLEQTSEDNGGWRGEYDGWYPYSTPLEAVEDAIDIVNPALAQAFLNEAENTNGQARSYKSYSDIAANSPTPIFEAINSIQEGVRRDAISPMDGARILDRAYRESGIDGVREVAQTDFWTGNQARLLADHIRNGGSFSTSPIEYKGYVIDRSTFDGDITVQYAGDEVIFNSVEEAQAFIDEVTTPKQATKKKATPKKKSAKKELVPKNQKVSETQSQAPTVTEPVPSSMDFVDRGRPVKLDDGNTAYFYPSVKTGGENTYWVSTGDGPQDGYFTNESYVNSHKRTETEPTQKPLEPKQKMEKSFQLALAKAKRDSAKYTFYENLVNAGVAHSLRADEVDVLFERMWNYYTKNDLTLPSNKESTKEALLEEFNKDKGNGKAQSTPKRDIIPATAIESPETMGNEDFNEHFYNAQWDEMNHDLVVEGAIDNDGKIIDNKAFNEVISEYNLTRNQYNDLVDYVEKRESEGSNNQPLEGQIAFGEEQAPTETKKKLEKKSAKQKIQSKSPMDITDEEIGSMSKGEVIRALHDLGQMYRDTTSGSTESGRIFDKIEHLALEFNSLQDYEGDEIFTSDGGDGSISIEDDKYYPKDIAKRKEQFDIVSHTNPAEDDVHTWIRAEDDIKTFEEALREDGIDGDAAPDFTEADIEKAKETGKITVYSSHNIKNGDWVTPSYTEAKNYAGDGKVYKATVPLDAVAWVDTLQGQLATYDDVDVTEAKRPIKTKAEQKKERVTSTLKAQTEQIENTSQTEKATRREPIEISKGEIKSSDPNAEAKLTERIEQSKAWQERMKEANAYFKKNGTLDGFDGLSNEQMREAQYGINQHPEGKPFPSYQLTNNSQNIKRLEGRLAEVKRLSKIQSSKTETDNYTMTMNTDESRIEYKFDGRPSSEVTNLLKKHGFKWRPSKGVWQRQITDNAIWVNDNIIKPGLEKIYGETTQNTEVKDTTTQLNPERLKELEQDKQMEEYHRELEQNGFVPANTMALDTGLGDLLSTINNAMDTSKSVVGEIVDTFNKVFNPYAKRSERETSLFFEFKGEREKSLAQLQKALPPLKKMFDKMSMADQLAFIDNYQNGRRQRNADLQKVDEFIRKTIEPLTQGLRDLDPNFQGIDNYLPQIWKERGKRLRTGTELMQKRGMVGDKSFTRKRIYDTYYDGINAGLTPVTTNPIELLEHIVTAETRYITAHKLVDALKEEGFIKFFPQTERLPNGWTELDDPIFRTFFPTQTGRMGQIGRYAAVRGTGDILHNWLMPNHVRQSSIGNTLANMKNRLTQVELALSGFHYVQTYMTALQEATNIGLQEIFNSGDLRGIGKIVNPLGGTVKAQKTGSKLMALALDEDTFMKDPKNVKWLNEHPEAKQIIDLWWKGGGKLSQNNYEDMGKQASLSVRETMRMLTTDPSFGGVIKGVSSIAKTASESITKPLFEQVIPSLKMGFFMMQMSRDMQTRSGDLANGRITIEQLARENIDQMDDLFGAMNYDNRNWNRDVKQILQTVFRSPTWWYGNIHMYKEIGAEQVRNISAMLEKGTKGKILSKQQKVLLGKHTGFAMGLAYVSAVIGSMIHLLMSGEPPKEWKDMIAPWTGAYDKNGEKVRFSAPGYIKSWINMVVNPVGSVTSATSGFADLLFRLATNKDYYGNYIMDRSDTIGNQAKQLGTYLVTETAIPFAPANVWQDFKDSRDDSGNVDWEQFLKTVIPDIAGISKAPNVLRTSKFKRDVAEAYEKEMASRVSYAPTKKTSKERQERKADLRQRIFDGTATDEEIQKAIKDGVITLASRKNAKMYTYAYQWKSLSKDTREVLWNQASTEEKQVLAAVEITKKPDTQNPAFVADWKNGKVKVPGQDVISNSKAYKKATFEETQEALYTVSLYNSYKETQSYKPKDSESSSNPYARMERIIDIGYNTYDAAMLRQKLNEVESNKDKNGKAISGSLKTNQINCLIRLGYSQAEAKKIVKAYRNDKK